MLARGGCRLNILIYSPEAIKDVRAAARYLAKRTLNEKYGDELVRAVAKACEGIAETPTKGIEHPKYELRSFPVRSYRIYYQMREDRVEIARILHHRRNADRQLRRWMKSRER